MERWSGVPPLCLWRGGELGLTGVFTTPGHWHRSLVTGPWQWWAVGTHPSQPPVRARQTFAQTWKHTKLTYIYILSIIIFMLTPNKLWCVHGSLPCPMEGVECGGKDAQTEKKLSTLSTKKLKTWKYIQRLFLFREACINYSNMEEPCWCYHASEKYTVNWREMLHLFVEFVTKELCLFWSE